VVFSTAPCQHNTDSGHNRQTENHLKSFFDFFVSFHHEVYSTLVWWKWQALLADFFSDSPPVAALPRARGTEPLG